MDEQWTDDAELLVIVDPFDGTWWRQGGRLTGADLAYTKDAFKREEAR